MRHKLSQTGSAFVAVILMFPFLILLAALYTQLTVNGFILSKGDQWRTYAQLAVDGGIDAAMDEITQDPTWTGTGGETILQNSAGVKTTYEVTVTDVDPSNKIMAAIGRSYRQATPTSVESTVRINVNLRAVSSGEYSVVGGVGGLIMSNSARILGGDVFINGKVTLSNSAQIGLSTNPVNLSVAHQSCPSPATATYPIVCNSGENGEPITFNNSAHIYGTVKANNQTSGANMTNPGLQTPYCLIPAAGPNCITPQPLPYHDRDSQKLAVASSTTGAAASCSNGSRTWAANLKIVGDVSISNTCRVTVEGNVWITGSLSLSNSAVMIVGNLMGATRPVIMVDGNTARFSNNSVLLSNVNSTGFQIITYKSDASCSPDCSNVTGTDLFNSQNDTTIELNNSAAGANSIFYARWTKVLVNNSGQLGALVGQTVQLSNSGTITFGTSTGTGTTFWVIDGYRRVF